MNMEHYKNKKSINDHFIFFKRIKTTEQYHYSIYDPDLFTQERLRKTDNIKKYQQKLQNDELFFICLESTILFQYFLEKLFERESE
jgi:hypothetical protein